MRIPDLETMDFEELWRLHEELTKILSEKIVAEKLELEKRLAQLNRAEKIGEAGSALGETKTNQPPRRKYPKVLPKYCNPEVPSETWSGRGKQPKWIASALKSGYKLEDFRIAETDKGPTDKNARGGRQP